MKPKLYKNLYKHGHASRRTGHTSEYLTWLAMKGRCCNPKDMNYKNYGGRGIKMCKRWRDSYAAFLSDMGRRPHGKTIERKNNNGPYSPKNCRWATRIDQGNNRRSNRRIKFRGVTLTLAQWSRKVGMSYNSIQSRLNVGWPVKYALTVPRSKGVKFAWRFKRKTKASSSASR